MTFSSNSYDGCSFSDVLPPILTVPSWPSKASVMILSRNMLKKGWELTFLWDSNCCWELVSYAAVEEDCTDCLSWQWSFLVLIIVTQSSQVYQQTRSLGYSESRTTRHGLLWKKEEKKKKKTRSRYTSPQRTSLVTCEIPLPVWDRDSDLSPFRRVFTSVSFFTSLHLWTISVSPSETWNLSGDVLSVSWRRLFGTHCQPISEICQIQI